MAYQKTHHDRGYHDPDYKNKKRNDKIKEEKQRKIQYDKDCTELITLLEQLNGCGARPYGAKVNESVQQSCECFHKYVGYRCPFGQSCKLECVK